MKYTNILLIMVSVFISINSYAGGDSSGGGGGGSKIRINSFISISDIAGVVLSNDEVINSDEAQELSDTADIKALILENGNVIYTENIKINNY